MIEPLPIEFKKNQRAFRQLARKGIVALYEVRNLTNNYIPHQLIGFELIIIRHQKAHSGKEWNYPERERYPSTREFGRYAWSFANKTRELAELGFDLLATMPFNRSKCSTLSDFSTPKGHHSGPAIMRRFLASVTTGRPLPAHGRIRNASMQPTERLTEIHTEQSETNR